MTHTGARIRITKRSLEEETKAEGEEGNVARGYIEEDDSHRKQ